MARCNLSGKQGSRSAIERASAVTGPWSTLVTPAAPLNGLSECFDTNPLAGAAFYRLSQP